MLFKNVICCSPLFLCIFNTLWCRLKYVRKRNQIHCINVHIWNLERWYQRSYVQGSKGDTDVKNRLLVSLEGWEDGMIWEKSTETCTLPYVKQMSNTRLKHVEGTRSWWSGTKQRDRVGREAGGWDAGLGTHVYLWSVYVDVCQKPSRYYKLKLINFKKTL